MHLFFNVLKIIVILIFVTSCGDRSLGGSIINWHEWEDSPKKEYCRKCSIDAHLGDCRICLGHDPVPKEKTSKLSNKGK